jgi:hypothetical protein
MWRFFKTDTNSYVNWRANRLIDRSLCAELNESNHFINNDEDWNLLKKRAFRRLQIDVASFQWWTKMRLTRKTLKRHCIRYECWRYADHLNWVLMCTCLRKWNRSISCWRSTLCWHKSTFERFFSFHTKNENRLKTSYTTSKRRRCVKISESSIYHIHWSEISLIKKSWFRFCYFSRCIVILKKWFFFIIFLSFACFACSNCFDNCLISTCWVIFLNVTTIWICIEEEQERWFLSATSWFVSRWRSVC